MKSLDTNILLYALNEDCPEHSRCASLVEGALAEAGEWVIADQLWFELYRLLRNPAVLATPLGPSEAAGAIAWYRERSGWLHCAWEPEMMEELSPLWAREDFPARRCFDLVLAVSLRRNGVEEFYTRNTKDFEGLGFRRLLDPLV